MAPRWWTYQRERFPILAVGPLTALVGATSVVYSARLRGPELPRGGAIVVAAASTLLCFWQLRVADEFKDFDHDRRHRAELPVPMGLVQLRELAGLAVISAAVQAALALWLHPTLLLLLGVVWLYQGLMAREFFVGDWLKVRAGAYMLSHMVILPLVTLYASACDWLTVGAAPPRGLAWLLATSYATGLALELGRKIRAPRDERPGIETYSAAWGPGFATLCWMATLTASALLTIFAAVQIDRALPAAAVLVVPLLVTLATGGTFLRKPGKSGSRWIDAESGLWTLLVYLCLGTLSLWGRDAASLGAGAP